MKTARSGIVLVAMIASLLAVGLTLAQSGTPAAETAQNGITLHSSVIGSSGGYAESDTSSLQALIGQPLMADESESTGGVTLRSGFAPVVFDAQKETEVDEEVDDGKLYLPVVYR
jgi:hypothetical protein